MHDMTPKSWKFLLSREELVFERWYQLKDGYLYHFIHQVFLCISFTFLLLLRAGLTLAFGCYCLTPMSSVH